MFLNKFRTVKGKLNYVSDSGMIGINPVISRTVPYPGAGLKPWGRASYKIKLDGELFTLKAFYKRGNGPAGRAAYGYEVYVDDKLLTTSFWTHSDLCLYNWEYGSREFFYKGNWYVILNKPLNITKGLQLMRYPKLILPGIRLLKFRETRAPKINEIVKDFRYDNDDERNGKKYIRKLWGDENISVKTIKW